MSYRVEVSGKVEKYLAALRDEALKKRIVAVMRDLEKSPRPVGCVKLTGSNDLFRIRAGDYRIIYQIQDQRLVVLIVDVGHRREIYR